MQINSRTQVVAVLGHPIAHTASPAMFNAAFKALDLNWCYLAFDVKPSDLGTTLRGLTAAGVVGVNLTVPHKILVMRYINCKERNALQLGAVNTIKFFSRNRTSSIHGYNTDGYGLLKALQEKFSFRPQGKIATIIGCGGAGRSAAIQLALSGAKKLILLNRTRSKAFAVARAIRFLGTKTICVFSAEPCDLVIQATSLGLNNRDPLPISRTGLQRCNPKLFFDMIYSPAETSIMKIADQLGCRISGGLEMLLHQGVKAFEIWTGRKAPIKIMRQALHREIYKRETFR